MVAGKMRVAVVPSANADFEIVEKDIPTPGPHEVLIKVHACGICHSDCYVRLVGSRVSHFRVPQVMR